MGVGSIFSRGGTKVDWIFPVGAKVTKVQFTHWKLRKRPFLLKIKQENVNFKFEVGALPPLSDAHGCDLLL